jgi:ABC-type glycerol-3-phosphate transport system substrate-binding protein
MKKLFIVLMAVMAMGAFAGPSIVALVAPPGAGDTRVPDAVAKTLADFPGATIEVISINLADGSTMSMDAMLAAGTPPNVYVDTMVRASKYLVPEFAMPLNGLVRDLDKYQKGILEPYSRGGKVLALPQPGGAQGMCINLDIMRDIGFTVKPDWTVDDFLKMAELVKAKYQGKKWATGMFAANQSGDYLLHNWFPAFGAEYYKGGDYNKATIAQTGGAKVYAFYQALAAKGYIPPSASTLNDDDYAAQWANGLLAATAFFPGWCAGYLQTAMDQKMIDKPFDYAFVPFPRGPGVKAVPTYISNAAIIVHKTGKIDVDKISARLAEYINGPIGQDWATANMNTVSNRIDTKPPTNVHALAVANIAQKNGVYDCGLTDPRFTERRSLQYPILQKLLTGKLSPDEAIKAYESALSGVK